MKKLLFLLFFSSCFVMIVFVLFLDFETQVEGLLQARRSLLSYALLSSFLMMSDILLPVPSSLIMILNGRVLGVFWGAVLSLLTGLSSSVLGFYLGRRSAKLLNRFFSRQELLAGNKLFLHYGTFGIALSKVLPVLSESVSFVAGTTLLSLRTFMAYSFIGQGVVSLLYAFVGGLVVEVNSNLISAAIIGLTLLLSWLLQRLITHRNLSSVPKNSLTNPTEAADRFSR